MLWHLYPDSLQYTVSQGEFLHYSDRLLIKECSISLLLQWGLFLNSFGEPPRQLDLEQSGQTFRSQWRMPEPNSPACRAVRIHSLPRRRGRETTGAAKATSARCSRLRTPARSPHRSTPALRPRWSASTPPMGNTPCAGLIADAYGDLFGTTSEGGGTVFRIQNIGTVAAPVYALTTLASFNDPASTTPMAIPRPA